MKQKIKLILNTNIIVSATINNSGLAYKTVKATEQTYVFQVALSPQIVDEYLRVATYKRINNKYPGFSNQLALLIQKLSSMGKFYEPQKKFNLIKDKSDNIFLDLAHESKADYIITGNKNDFTITQFEQTKIVTPKEFCELYEANVL